MKTFYFLTTTYKYLGINAETEEQARRYAEWQGIQIIKLLEVEIIEARELK